MSTVLWRDRVDGGAEVARLARDGDGWRLSGTVLTQLDGRPAEARYAVSADAGWVTRAVEADVRLAGGTAMLVLAHDGAGAWTRVGDPVPELAGCLDVDLEVSPVTNTLPIRRLGLAPGASAEITAAWVRFPALAVERSAQRYTRLEDRAYRYESGAFAARLDVDADGVVLDYEGIWTAVARG